MKDITKITEADIQFIKSIIDIDANVKKCQLYIKEHYNIDSLFYPETLSIQLICSNINESLNLVAAKEHINGFMTEEFIQVTF